MKPWMIKGLIILALFLALIFLRRPAANLAQKLFLPLIARFSTWSERIDHAGRSVALPNDGSLQVCETRLQAKIVDAARLSALEQENRLLRAQASFLDESGYDHVGARVIGRRIDHIHARLLIDRGTNDLIEEGQAVIAENGLLVGKIVDAGAKVSTVELLSDIDSRIAMASAKDGQLIGVLEGRGNGAVLLTYIPSSVDVAAEDLLLTAGTEDKIPPRLPVGVVNAVTRTSKDPFYQASIDPSLRIERLSFLSVLRPSALTR
jgi:rod shape-determining protein MreC